MSTNSKLSRAVDRAVAEENRRAIEDARNGREEPFSLVPRYPAGTPEYEAYRAELRAELAKWKNREFPYVVEED